MFAGLRLVWQPGAVLGINNPSSHWRARWLRCVWLIIDAGTSVTSGFRVAFLVAGACVTAGALVSLLLIDPEADQKRLAQWSDAEMVKSPA